MTTAVGTPGYYADGVSHSVQSCGIVLLVSSRTPHTVTGCSNGASRKLRSNLADSVLGLRLDELFTDATRVQEQLAGGVPTVFPLTSAEQKVTYCATITRLDSSMTIMVLDLREQPKVDGISTLAVPLWEAVESLFAANDMTSLLQLATTTMRRVTRSERCVLYRLHQNAAVIASSPQTISPQEMVNENGVGANFSRSPSIAMYRGAESKLQDIEDTSHPVVRPSYVARLLSCTRQTAQNFHEEHLLVTSEPLQYLDAASLPVDVSCSTLFASSAEERAALRAHGLQQILSFPINSKGGECWGVIVAYNYKTTCNLTLQDLTCCESICRTLSAKVFIPHPLPLFYYLRLGSVPALLQITLRAREGKKWRERIQPSHPTGKR